MDVGGAVTGGAAGGEVVQLGLGLVLQAGQHLHLGVGRLRGEAGGGGAQGGDQGGDLAPVVSIIITSLALLTSTSVVRARGGAADTGEHLYLATLARRSPVITHLGAGLLSPPSPGSCTLPDLWFRGSPSTGGAGAGGAEPFW